MPNDHENIYKIAVLGDEGSGKTALLVRFLTGRYIVDYDPTIEDTYRKIFLVHNEPESVDILDTTRKGKSALRQQFLECGDGFVLVYSITDRRSFEMVENYREEISKSCGRHKKTYKISLVANKCDLNDAREVTKEEGEQLAVKYGWSFCEASAADNTGISQAFFGLSGIPNSSPTHILGSNSACHREKNAKKLHKRHTHNGFNLFRWHSQ